MICLNFILVTIFFYNSKKIFIQNKFQKIMVNVYYFVISIIKDSVSVKRYSFVLLFYVVFLFIFISNIVGMVPYSMTITSHLILTIYFSLS